ncbi:hypothetical protein SCARR_01591 [Pontiella sulfatireligans]|uniref:Arylsulfotransferase (ASST) n=1 Tax=Pontiella sulfatireligans TaxID=2750658 RepID=A0A6C2UH42_9BACT|nr:hypothetical protein SCARR_01591 [Pontiella sulfatireligans]
MRKTAALSVILICSVTAAFAQLPRLLVAGGNKVFVLEPDKTVSWVYQANAGGLYDAWPLESGHVLFSTRCGVHEVTPQKKIVWEYVLEKKRGVEIDACQPLENGNVLMIDSGNNRLVEVNKDNDIVVEVLLPSTSEKIHWRYRLGRKNRRGNYLVAMLPDKIIEVDAAGKLHREIDLKRYGKPQGQGMLHSFEVLELDDGNLLVSTGFDGRWLEIDADGNAVWEFSKQTHPDIEICFAGGAQQLENGHFILCNADYHTTDPEQQKVQLLEVTPDHKIVNRVLFDELAPLIQLNKEKGKNMDYIHLIGAKPF